MLLVALIIYVLVITVFLFPEFNGAQDYLSMGEYEPHDFTVLDRFEQKNISGNKFPRQIDSVTGNLFVLVNRFSNLYKVVCLPKPLVLYRIVNRVHDYL